MIPAVPAQPPEAREYVYYRRADYAGFWRRLASEAIDLTLILALFGGVFALSYAGLPLPSWWPLICLALVYLYLTVAKRSRFRTVGYIATGIRIVNLKGTPPSLFMISLRLFWWVLGPLNSLIDLIYMTGDLDRQAIRDKMMQTYVIKRGAEPLGRGHRRSIYMDFMGLNLIVWEVVRPGESDEQPEPEDGSLDQDA